MRHAGKIVQRPDDPGACPGYARFKAWRLEILLDVDVREAGIHQAIQERQAFPLVSVEQAAVPGSPHGEDRRNAGQPGQAPGRRPFLGFEMINAQLNQVDPLPERRNVPEVSLQGLLGKAEADACPACQKSLLYTYTSERTFCVKTRRTRMGKLPESRSK